MTASPPDPGASPPTRIGWRQLPAVAGLAVLLVIAAAILSFKTITGDWPWMPAGSAQAAFGGPFALADANGRPAGAHAEHREEDEDREVFEL